MPDINSFLVRKSGTNYEASWSGSYVMQRANAQWEALMIFDNSDDWITSVFAEEDEVEIYVDSVSAANKLMVGYIDDIGDVADKNLQKTQRVHITGWGDYLAGKTVFEKDYIRTKTAADVFSDAHDEISGLAESITGLATSPDHDIKRNFYGTYVKDAWFTAAENAGADYFVDETKTLRAFGFGALDLDETSTGLIYKVKDIPSVSADTLMINRNFPYSFHRNVEERFRSVIATNGLVETFPYDLDLFQTLMITKGSVSDTRGKPMSQVYRQFGNIANYDVDTNPTGLSHNPRSGVDLGDGYIANTMQVVIASNSTDADVFIQGWDVNNVAINMGIVATDWQRIAFYIKKALTGATINKIYMRLYTVAGSGDYWEREILADLNGTDFTYIAYDLPANTTDATTNGWTKNGSPTTVDAIYFRFENGAGSITGYTANSYMEFAKMHFFRRRRKTITGAGTPATEKIMVDASMKNIDNLTSWATKEQARANVVAKHGEFTILGNPAFKRPAYNIEVDFTDTLGSGRSATVRIDSIKHFLQNSRHYTTVTYNNSFSRP